MKIIKAHNNTYTTLLYKYGDEWDNDHLTIGTKWDDIIKPFNFGVNIEGGVEINRFQITASYTYGLSNLSNGEGSTLSTNVIGLTAAVKFGKVDNGSRRYRR